MNYRTKSLEVFIWGPEENNTTDDCLDHQVEETDRHPMRHILYGDLLQGIPWFVLKCLKRKNEELFKRM